MIKLLKVLLLTLIAFLLQSSVAQPIAIGGIAPNLALAILAAVSIALGKKYTFFMALAIGYLLEIRQPAMNYLNQVLYPVSAMMGALLFADKSERKLAEERASERGLHKRQMNPLIRTVLAGMVSSFLYELVHLVYIYLNGVQASMFNIGRALMAIVYTMICTAVLQFPIRWLMGTNKLKKARA